MRDGWVDNLKPTLLIAIICFLVQGHNLKKTHINGLPTRREVSYFALKIELNNILVFH